MDLWCLHNTHISMWAWTLGGLDWCSDGVGCRAGRFRFDFSDRNHYFRRVTEKCNIQFPTLGRFRRCVIANALLEAGTGTEDILASRVSIDAIARNDNVGIHANLITLIPRPCPPYHSTDGLCAPPVVPSHQDPIDSNTIISITPSSA